MDNTKFYECWKYIEKRAFYPRSRHDIKDWLYCFMKFFYNIYEQAKYFPGPFNKPENEDYRELIFPRIHTRLKFIIKLVNNIPNFSVQLKWGKKYPDKANLQFEYDSDFQCEWNYVNESKKIIKKPDFNECELDFILKNMIVHPAVHCHIFNESWVNKNISPNVLHEIRLRIPTTNPFLFLYQVSFQFLSIIGESKKDEELKRLTRVILENKNKDSLKPGKLFSL